MHEPALDDAGAHARRDWETLRTNVSNKSMTVPQSYVAHTELVPKLLKVNDQIGDHFGLSLDPDSDTYQLIQAMFYQLPHLSEELGKTRAKGAGLLAKKEASPDDRLLLSSIVARVTDRLDQTLTAFNKASAANHDFQAKLGPAMQEAAQAAGKISELALAQIIKPEALTYSAEEYVNLSTQAIDLQFKLNAAASKELDATLSDKISQFKRIRWTMLGSCPRDWRRRRRAWRRRPRPWKS